MLLGMADLDPIISEQLATTTVNAICMHTEAASRLSAAEALEADRCTTLLEEIRSEMDVMAFALAGLSQLAREYTIPGLSDTDRQLLINLDCQLVASLYVASGAAGILARSGKPSEGRPPSAMLMSQEQTDWLLTDSVWQWLSENATKESRRQLKALRASLSLPALS